MFQKNFVTLLMAAVATAAVAFYPQEDDAPKQEPENQALQTIVEDGKLFIIDDDGEKREIDISGANSIMIRQSNRTINENGEEQVEAHGEAIIIGPDGEKTIIELSGPGGIELPGMALQLDQLNFEIPEVQWMGVEDMEGFAMPGVFRIDQGAVGNFMIGVHCTPVDGALQSHLQLDEGVGLVIRSVADGSPAAEAELQQFDILMYADDSELGSIADLTAAIDSAGEEERSTTFTLIREGAERQVELAPVKRPENQLSTLPGFQLDPRIQIQQMGPGIILGGAEEDMAEAIDRLRQEMMRMQEDMKQMMERDR